VRKQLIDFAFVRDLADRGPWPILTPS